jgi:hypothetical protein
LLKSNSPLFINFATIPATIDESTPPEINKPKGASPLTSFLTISTNLSLSSAKLISPVGI